MTTKTNTIRTETRELTNNYFETFSAAIDAAAARAGACAVLSAPTELWSIVQEPLFYGQSRYVSCELDTYKGKPTRKYFHVTIARLDSGRYELTTYVL